MAQPRAESVLSTAQKGAHHTQERWARRIIGLTAVVLVCQMAVIAWAPPALTDPDEALFALVARHMRESGDWVVPTFRQHPFLDRPALAYWFLASSSALVGDTDLAYRLPSMVLGVATILVTGAIALELFGPLAGALAAFVLSTSIGGVVICVSVGHDTALLFFVTLSIWLGLRMSRGSEPAVEATAKPSKGRKEIRGGIAIGIAAGLGILSKGLLGLALPALALAWFWPMRRWSWRMPLLAVGVALLVGAWWYVLVEWRVPGYLRYFLIDRHLGGFFTNQQRHGERSALVYLPTLLIAASPGIFLLFDRAALWPAEGRRRAVVGWLISTVLFFMIAGSKNPTYLMPALPPVAILVAARIRDWMLSAAPSAIDISSSRLPWIWTSMYLIAGPIVLASYHRAAPVAWWGWMAAMGIGLATWKWVKSRAAVRTVSMTEVGSDEPHPYIGNRFSTLVVQSITWVVTTAACVALLLPQVMFERSTGPTIAALKDHLATYPEISSQPVWWFNEVPPSAEFYGGPIRFQRVLYRDLLAAPEEPVLLLCRKGRLDEVRGLPLVAGARAIDLGGKYRLFCCPGATSPEAEAMRPLPERR